MINTFDNKKKNLFLKAEKGEFNLKGMNVQLILERVRKYTECSKKWICVLVAIVILQIYFAFREPVLIYKIINLVLIALGLMAGFMAIRKIIKIQKTIK